MTWGRWWDRQPRPHAGNSSLSVAGRLFLLALAIRLIYLAWDAGNPTASLPVVDSGTYDLLARSLARGEKPGPALFWQSFFYPVFLAAVYGLGGSLAAAKVVQAVVGSATVAMTFLLGERIGGRRIGVVAAVVAACYGPLIFFEGELLTAGWEAFWAVALLLLLGRATDQPRPLLLLALGFCGGLAVITRPTFLPFLGAGCLWLAVHRWRDPDGRRTVPLLAACLLAGFLVVVLPVAALCLKVTGRFAFLPSSGGINFFIGNNPDSCRTIAARPGWEWNRLTRLPADAGVRGAWASSDYFYQRALEYAVGQPMDFARGLGGKAVRFISSREIPRNLDIYLFREWSPPLRLLVWKLGTFGFPFGLLLPLAAIGALRHRGRIPPPAWLFLGLYPLSVVLVFTASRYRLPLVPLLAVLAALGVESLREMARRRERRRLAAAAGSGLLLLLLGAAGPFCEEQLPFEAELYAAVGSSALDRGDVAAALSWFRRAAATAPEMPDAWNSLGAALMRAGNPREALDVFSRALAVKPDFIEALNNKGLALAVLGRTEEAAAAFREALTIEPRYAVAHNNLALSLAALSRVGDALAHYREALAIEPDYAHAHRNLADALAAQGAWEEAAFHRREVLRIDPGDREAAARLRETESRLGAGRRP